MVLMKQAAALLRSWWDDPSGRVVLALAAVCCLGPFGEMFDLVVASEMEFDLIALDVGLDAVVTAFLPFGWMLLLLFGLIIAARGLASIACGGVPPMRALVPVRAKRPGKVPIR